MSRNIILIGAPGVGKGTNAEYIVKEYNIPHISIGDILRENIANKTKLGEQAQLFMSEGKLVPDEVVIGIVEKRLQEDDCKDGFLFDGFPRTINQAEALDKLKKIDHVFNLVVSEEIILLRICNRRVCPNCGKVTNKTMYDKDTCPECNTGLVQRSDDSEEIIKKRLEVFYEQTQPVIEYYQKKGNLHIISGDQGSLNSFNKIKEVLG